MAERNESVDVDRLVQGLLRGERAPLARAITLVESRREDLNAAGQAVLERVLSRTGQAIRVGVSGVPGVGKSSFIEGFGLSRVAAGQRVAVLAVDPSSQRSGGSILGDKARMSRLAQAPEAFIRPSPTADTLGGVARRTREVMLLVEAAGYDLILVETVGVGQSETAVAEMTDFFCVLMLPGAGDELQGIKKGILELADLVVVNKADGDRVVAAESAREEYAAALRYIEPRSAFWKPRALAISALEERGFEAVWAAIEEQSRLGSQGEHRESRRAEQRVRWLEDELQARLQELFRRDDELRSQLERAREQVSRGERAPGAMAEELVQQLRGGEILRDGSKKKP